MIRINLMRDTIIDRGGATLAVSGAGGIENGGGSFDFLLKLFLMLSPCISLLVFEQMRLTKKRDKIAEIQLVLVQRKTENDSLKTEIEAVKKFEIEKKQLDTQIQTIKKLSKERLQNVKALAAIQSLIPQRAWLIELKMDGDKIEIRGFAPDETVASEFVASLEESIFFRDVFLRRTEDQRQQDGSTVKQFLVDASMEGQ